MRRRDDEVIIKLDKDELAHLMACIFASLMVSKDEEIQNDIKHLIRTITSQFSE